MATEVRGGFRPALVLASVAAVLAGGVLMVHAAGTAAEPNAAPVLSASAPDPAPPLTPSAAGSTATSPAATRARPGVPVAIDIPIASANHPRGVHAAISSHRLNRDATLYVPPDPRAVAWASQDARPGSDHGTAILVSHIDYVIDGKTVPGAFADLTQYAAKAVGRRLTLHLADGRAMVYRIVGGREYSKSELDAAPGLRRQLYDQSSLFGPARHPSGRLLLVSCGGPFDPDTGEYEDNVFLYALPVS